MLYSLIISKEKLVSWLVVFYVPTIARSFRDGTPIYWPLRSSVFTPFPPVIEPRAVAWQSITLPLCHASSSSTMEMGGGTLPPTRY